jgi:hypothetical protein
MISSLRDVEVVAGAGAATSGSEAKCTSTTVNAGERAVISRTNEVHEDLGMS